MIQLLIKYDNDVLYVRRNCCEFTKLNLEKWKNRWQLQIVNKCYKSLQVLFVEENIDCAHRIRMEYTEKKNSGKEVKSIILKFTSWNTMWKMSKYGVFLVQIRENMDQKKLHIWALLTQWKVRKQFYDSRPEDFKDGKKK